MHDALPRLPPYPAAAVLALLALFATDDLTVPGPRTAVYHVSGALLCGLLGALVGLALKLVLAAVGRTLGRGGWLLWLLAGGASGLGLAASLGAFGRLGTRYETLARWTIGGALLWGLGLAALLIALQPTARAARGWLPSRGPVWRALAAVALLCGAASFVYADHTLYVGLYLQAHVALRAAALLTATGALSLWAQELRLPALSRRGMLALVIAFAIPIGLVRDSDGDTVQAFVSRPWPATVLRSARAVFDLDRDGFSYVLAGGDCDELNAYVNPGATEVPDNGIDDNCAFGDRKSKPEPSDAVPIPKTPAPMSIVLITVDTLRADRVGLQRPVDAEDATMPALRAWADEAVRFHRAYTPGAWTSVAVGSFMRGRYARKLEWTAYHETSHYRMLRAPADDLIEGEKLTKLFPLAWRDPNEPLPHWLQRRGMKTLAVVDDGFSQMLSKELGADRGFETYREVNAEPNDAEGLRKKGGRPIGRRHDATTASMASSLLRYSIGKQPFFMWVHFFGPHTPSSEYAGVKRFGDSIAQQYDHEVLHADRQIMRVIEAVEQLEQPTAVFVTSDHGEKFFERYRSHGADLSDDVLHVPLLAKVPGWVPTDVHTPVTLVDLMPTILALTETPGPTGLDGMNLAPLVMGGPAAAVTQDGPRLLLSDTWQYGRDHEAFNDRVAAYDGERKVELDRLEHAFLMYDQQRIGAQPVRMQGLAIDRYARRILGYLEEAGGSLQLGK